MTTKCLIIGGLLAGALGIWALLPSADSTLLSSPNAKSVPLSIPAESKKEIIEDSVLVPQPRREGRVITPSMEDLARIRKEIETMRAEYQRKVQTDYADRVNRTYLPILQSFGLTPDIASKVGDLLVDRYCTADDIVETTRASRINRNDAKAFYENSIAEIDQAIMTLVGPEIALDIQRMREASIQLGALAEGTAWSHLQAVSPLTPRQQFELSVGQYEVYFTGPNARAESASTVDPTTGLTPLDKQFLARLQSSLNGTQQALVREGLLRFNKPAAAR
jgi:hypothetical protein